MTVMAAEPEIVAWVWSTAVTVTFAGFGGLAGAE